MRSSAMRLDFPSAMLVLGVLVTARSCVTFDCHI